MVWPLVPALACGQTGDMPCCRPSVPCDLGIGTGHCCRTVSASSSSEPIKGVMQPADPGRLQQSHGSSPFSDDVTSHLATVLRFDRQWFPPSHDDSTPLFLRNASILR